MLDFYSPWKCHKTKRFLRWIKQFGICHWFSFYNFSYLSFVNVYKKLTLLLINLPLSRQKIKENYQIYIFKSLLVCSLDLNCIRIFHGLLKAKLIRSYILPNIYLSNVNNRNPRKMYEICSRLTIMPMTSFWCFYC